MNIEEYDLEIWKYMKKPFRIMMLLTLSIWILVFLLMILYGLSIGYDYAFYIILLLFLIVGFLTLIFLIFGQKLFSAKIILFSDHFKLVAPLQKTKINYHDIESVEFCRFRDSLSKERLLLIEKNPFSGIEKGILENMIVSLKLKKGASIPFYMFPLKMMGKMNILVNDPENLYQHLMMLLEE